MTFKPGDFFIGLLDFFSVLLPGAILSYIHAPFLQKIIGTDILAGGSLCVSIFLIISYITGHFVYSLGSMLDEYVYDYFRIKFYTSRDQAYGEANTIKKSITTNLINDEKSVNLYKWSRGVIESLHPTLITPIYRLEADQKFFRSFLIVAVINTIRLLILMIKSFIVNGHDGNFAGDILFWLLICVLSMYRYINRRFNGTRQAFETIIVLRSLGKI